MKEKNLDILFLILKFLTFKILYVNWGPPPPHFSQFLEVTESWNFSLGFNYIYLKANLIFILRIFAFKAILKPETCSDRHYENINISKLHLYWCFCSIYIFGGFKLIEHTLILRYNSTTMCNGYKTSTIQPYKCTQIKIHL